MNDEKIINILKEKKQLGSSITEQEIEMIRSLYKIDNLFLLKKIDDTTTIFDILLKNSSDIQVIEFIEEIIEKQEDNPFLEILDKYLWSQYLSSNQNLEVFYDLRNFFSIVDLKNIYKICETDGDKEIFLHFIEKIFDNSKILCRDLIDFFRDARINIPEFILKKESFIKSIQESLILLSDDDIKVVIDSLYVFGDKKQEYLKLFFIYCFNHADSVGIFESYSIFDNRLDLNDNDVLFTLKSVKRMCDIAQVDDSFMKDIYEYIVNKMYLSNELMKYLVTFSFDGCPIEKIFNNLNDKTGWILVNFFEKYTLENQPINLAQFNDIKKIFKDLKIDNYLPNLYFMMVRLGVLDFDAALYFITPQDDGKYPFERFTVSSDFWPDPYDDYDDDNDPLESTVSYSDEEISWDDVDVIYNHSPMSRQEFLIQLIELLQAKGPDRIMPNIYIRISKYLGEGIFSHIRDEEFLNLIDELKLIVNNEYQEIMEYYISCFCIVYKNNPDLAKFSLQLLIESIKSNTIDESIFFEYKRFCKLTNMNVKTSCYIPYLTNHTKKCIVMKGKSFNPFTFIHETGHMIHDLLDELKMPTQMDFEYIINETKNHISQLEIEKFKEEYDSLFIEVRDKMREKLENDENFQWHCDFDLLLSKLDIPSDIKEVVQNTLVSPDERERFLTTQKEGLIYEMTITYIYTYYPWYDAISDIIDAIYEGIYSIWGFTGHGRDYYKDDNSKRFKEIFANYYLICALCPDKLELLKQLLGEKFIDYMSQYMSEIKDRYQFGGR